MSEEKQIEEMALELCRPRNIVKMIHHRTCGNCDTSSCDIYELCVDLYNAGYRKQSEWISVEERLPENENERVLVILKDIPLVDHIGTPKVDTDRYIDGRWVRWDRIITHWMPLPEPPKGGGE